MAHRFRSPRHAPALAVTLLLGALAAQSPVATAATSTNPASNLLAPVSPKARPDANSGASSTRSSAAGATNPLGGQAAGRTATSPGATGRPGGALGGTGTRAGGGLSGAGTQAGGTAPAAGTPTTTYAPPAGSGAASATPQTRTLGTLNLTNTKAGPQRRSSSSISDGAIALAALAALVALACAAWAIARWQAYAPRWAVSLRHSMAEAGFRASATWAEFTDWVRLGR